MKTRARLMLVFASVFCCYLHAAAQTIADKPLLIVKVDGENANFTQPTVISSVNREELRELRALLVEQLSGSFTIIPESDKRDCIEVALVLERLHTTTGSYYIGSSVIAVGKGESDLLVTHNPIVEATLKKVSAAIVFQLSVMQLQAYFPSVQLSSH